jgi:hypothetical protein
MEDRLEAIEWLVSLFQWVAGLPILPAALSLLGSFSLPLWMPSLVRIAGPAATVATAVAAARSTAAAGAFETSPGAVSAACALVAAFAVIHATVSAACDAVAIVRKAGWAAFVWRQAEFTALAFAVAALTSIPLRATTALSGAELVSLPVLAALAVAGLWELPAADAPATDDADADCTAAATPLGCLSTPFSVASAATSATATPAARTPPPPSSLAYVLQASAFATAPAAAFLQRRGKRIGVLAVAILAVLGAWPLFTPDVLQRDALSPGLSVRANAAAVACLDFFDAVPGYWEPPSTSASAFAGGFEGRFEEAPSAGGLQEATVGSDGAVDAAAGSSADGTAATGLFEAQSEQAGTAGASSPPGPLRLSPWLLFQQALFGPTSSQSHQRLLSEVGWSVDDTSQPSRTAFLLASAIRLLDGSALLASVLAQDAMRHFILAPLVAAMQGFCDSASGSICAFNAAGTESVPVQPGVFANSGAPSAAVPGLDAETVAGLQSALPWAFFRILVTIAALHLIFVGTPARGLQSLVWKIYGALCDAGLRVIPAFMRPRADSAEDDIASVATPASARSKVSVGSMGSISARSAMVDSDSVISSTTEEELDTLGMSKLTFLGKKSGMCPSSRTHCFWSAMHSVAAFVSGAISYALLALLTTLLVSGSTLLQSQQRAVGSIDDLVLGVHALLIASLFVNRNDVWYVFRGFAAFGQTALGALLLALSFSIPVGSNASNAANGVWCPPFGGGNNGKGPTGSFFELFILASYIIVGSIVKFSQFDDKMDAIKERQKAHAAAKDLAWLRDVVGENGSSSTAKASVAKTPEMDISMSSVIAPDLPEGETPVAMLFPPSAKFRQDGTSSQGSKRRRSDAGLMSFAEVPKSAQSLMFKPTAPSGNGNIVMSGGEYRTGAILAFEGDDVETFKGSALAVSAIHEDDEPLQHQALAPTPARSTPFPTGATFSSANRLGSAGNIEMFSASRPTAVGSSTPPRFPQALQSPNPISAASFNRNPSASSVASFSAQRPAMSGNGSNAAGAPSSAHRPGSVLKASGVDAPSSATVPQRRFGVGSALGGSGTPFGPSMQARVGTHTPTKNGSATPVLGSSFSRPAYALSAHAPHTFAQPPSHTPSSDRFGNANSPSRMQPQARRPPMAVGGVSPSFSHAAKPSSTSLLARPMEPTASSLVLESATEGELRQALRMIIAERRAEKLFLQQLPEHTSQNDREGARRDVALRLGGFKRKRIEVDASEVERRSTGDRGEEPSTGAFSTHTEQLLFQRLQQSQMRHAVPDPAEDSGDSEVDMNEPAEDEEDDDFEETGEADGQSGSLAAPEVGHTRDAGDGSVQESETESVDDVTPDDIIAFLAQIKNNKRMRRASH